jgi:hypothetical protein
MAGTEQAIREQGVYRIQCQELRRKAHFASPPPDMPGVFFLLPGERNRLLSAQDGMRVVNLAVDAQPYRQRPECQK